ncbi:peptidoglycan-binding protein, partial [Microbulbifer mangrovi]|uniref:peptidoglycan-binding protein n=1 Tax=Microbulbifer mangrovi TaxID=927787 RepID=UPI001EFAFE8B
MSSTTKQQMRPRHCRHFYAIVALSCCALLPLMETAAGEEPEALGEEPKVQAEQTEPEQSASVQQGTVEPKKEAAAKPLPAPQGKEEKKQEEKTSTGTQTAATEPQKEVSKKNSNPDKQPYSGADSAVHFATAGNRLREQAARYREMNNQWQAIDPGPPLRAGHQDRRVMQLRKLLQLFGDYTGQPGPVSDTDDNPERFDAGVQLAVESYQRRHGMVVTGIADKATLRELERTPQELARLLELNAKRWDQLPDSPGQRYILVNVPDFQLQLIDRQRVVLSMKTVVGKSTKRTPEMTTKVVSVVFNPTWTVP